MATYGFGAHPSFYPTPTQQHAPAPTHRTPQTPTPTGSKPLSTDQKNALTVIQGILSQYGLASLSSVVLNYVKQGYNTDAINVLIQQTPEWKTRFAGNEIRAKNGLAPLDPATYLATEAAYGQAIKSAGLPPGFYDGGHDFAQWIGGDVSASEVQARAQDAAAAVDSADQGYVQALQDYYGVGKGQIAAYFLDQKRALPMLQQQEQAAHIGAAALDNGLNLSSADAARYASMGVTTGQAQNAYQTIAQALPGEQQLASIYHQAYGQQDLENELLGGSGQSALKRQQLNRTEQASFAGQGSVGNTLYNPGYGLSEQSSGKF